VVVAQSRLGQMLCRDCGNARDRRIGHELLRQAARAGDRRAQLEYARLCEESRRRPGPRRPGAVLQFGVSMAVDLASILLGLVAGALPCLGWVMQVQRRQARGKVSRPCSKSA
jgi:TPR repeat protein